MLIMMMVSMAPELNTMMAVFVVMVTMTASIVMVVTMMTTMTVVCLCHANDGYDCSDDDG